MAELITKVRSWYQKYQPTKLDDLQLPDHMRKKFEHYIANPHDTPNLIFVGLPGSGKTTLANILIRSFIKSKDDYLQINGSGLKMDVVRADGSDPSKGIIQRFAMMPPVKSPFRIMHLEELQRSNAQVQEVYRYLRALIEQTNKTTMWLITTNSIANIDGPLKQRFQIYTFNVLPKDFIKKYLMRILELENVDYIESDLDYIVDYHYPSVRAMVNILQQYSIDGKLQLDKTVIEFNSQIIQLIQNVLSTKDVNSQAFKKLIQLIKYNPALINLEYILKQLVYSLGAKDMLIVSRYIVTAANNSLPDITILALISDLLIGESKVTSSLSQGI